MAPLDVSTISDAEIDNESETDDESGSEPEVPDTKYMRQLCNGDSITDRSKRIQLIKMVILVISPMAVLLGLTCYFLTGSIWERTEMRKQKEALIYSTDLGQFIHSLQKERDQSALYLSAIGPDTKLYLLERYTETDEYLHELSSWPVDLVEDIEKNNRVQFRDKFTFQIYMNNHRNSLDFFNTTDYKEINFYTGNINILIKWMYNAITLANRVGGIWKSMVAYQKLLACKENAGVERALGSIFFTRGGFEDHEYYLWYVRKVHTFQYGFNTAMTYSKIIRSMDYYNHKQTRVQNLSTIIENYRSVISNRSAFDPSLTRATQFYDNMTLYLDQLYDVQVTVGQSIEGKFQENEQRSTKDIFLAIVIIAIVLAAIPIQVLSVHRQTSDIQSYALTLVDKTKELDVEKKRTESLLYQLKSVEKFIISDMDTSIVNIKMLPKSIALKLKNRKNVNAEHFNQATVMFTAINEFARLTKEYTPFQLISLLEEMYHVFDSKAKVYDVYKVEHIVDQCLVVSGVPKRNGRYHAAQIADMALDLMLSINAMESTSIPGEKISFQIGIHSGPVTAGIVGLVMMPKYSLFGDTLITASQIENTSLANMIHVSATTHKLLQTNNNYKFTCRGSINIKGNRDMLTYWLTDNREKYNSLAGAHFIDVTPKSIHIMNNETLQYNSKDVHRHKYRSNANSPYFDYEDNNFITPDHSVRHKILNGHKEGDHAKNPRTTRSAKMYHESRKEKKQKEKRKKKNQKESEASSLGIDNLCLKRVTPKQDIPSVRSTTTQIKNEKVMIERRNNKDIKMETHRLVVNGESCTDQIHSYGIAEHLAATTVPDKELNSSDDMLKPTSNPLLSCTTPVDHDMILNLANESAIAEYDAMKESTDTEGEEKIKCVDDTMLESYDYRNNTQNKTIEKCESKPDSSLPPITDLVEKAIERLDTAEVISGMSEISEQDTDIGDLFGSPC